MQIKLFLKHLNYGSRSICCCTAMGTCPTASVAPSGIHSFSPSHTGTDKADNIQNVQGYQRGGELIKSKKDWHSFSVISQFTNTKGCQCIPWTRIHSTRNLKKDGARRQTGECTSNVRPIINWFFVTLTDSPQQMKRFKGRYVYFEPT